tara:strand:- start:165 stop:956 length:792 start_codon:yes stop_codon:yes gene_type:complete
VLLTEDEKKLTSEYLENGYCIKKVSDINILEKIIDIFVELTEKTTRIKCISSKSDYLNNVHKIIKIDKLNDIRMNIINGINQHPKFREYYYKLAKPLLDTIVGNELAMQRRINLSIQLPNDDSSLLQVHADTWSGDSPFEVVVWLPIVDCYGTKTMYLLPPNKLKIIDKVFTSKKNNNSEKIFQEIKNDVLWLNIKFGEILIFNQSLPHGNRVNNEKETRWSMNCRFKSVFTPYGDKKLGEFFEPITIRAASKCGIEYEYPGE